MKLTKWYSSFAAPCLLGFLTTASPAFVSAASPAGGTLDWQFYDFFNVPLGEYFDNRSSTYGETPIGAECFTQSAIDNGICNPSDPAVPDLDTYPYTISSYTNENNNRRTVSAPFRFTATGTDILGYDLTEPIFLPVFNSSAPIGTYLDFHWVAKFVDTDAVNEMNAIPCSNPGIGDGYYMWSTITLEMDLQQSRRIFGVVAADATAAQAWWDSNTVSTCAQSPGSRGQVEKDLWDWFFAMGGEESSTKIGKYDIMNAYGWFLDQAMLDISTTVDPDGTTHVTIQHVAWGTSNLLDHMFYWGSTSYKDHHLDSTQAMGWQGMEPYAWYDDMIWSGTLNPGNIDFVLEGVMAYDFENISLPGPDGNYDQVDDISVWAFRPHLSDNLNDLYGHLESEMDRYVGVTDVETTPGSNLYGASRTRAFIPTTWDLFDGETVTFQFPTGNVPFYDPNLTPIGAEGTKDEFVVNMDQLALHRTHPAAYGNWNQATKTWTITGPTTTGGSVGSPGPDGIPGTVDDDYPDESWGAIYFVALPEPGSTIALVAGSGMLAMMYRRRSRRLGII
jgi:hypothetical protein